MVLLRVLLRVLLMADMGSKLPIVVHSDATAAIGIACRKGPGKIRHLDVTDL